MCSERRIGLSRWRIPAEPSTSTRGAYRPCACLRSIWIASLLYCACAISGFEFTATVIASCIETGADWASAILAEPASSVAKPAAINLRYVMIGAPSSIHYGDFDAAIRRIALAIGSRNLGFALAMTGDGQLAAIGALGNEHFGDRLRAPD